MDKYRSVEEKYIGAQGFIDDNIDTDISREKDHSKGLDAQSIVRITQQAKPRSCITTAMNLLVRVAASHRFVYGASFPNFFGIMIAPTYLLTGRRKQTRRAEGHGQGHQQSRNNSRNLKAQDATPSDNNAIIL